MKSKNTVRHTLVSAAAVAALALPLLAGATGKTLDLNDAQDQQALYQKLQEQSRKVCGSTNLHLTGSIERSVGNEECYRETLDVAVQRVNNSAIQEMHQRQASTNS